MATKRHSFDLMPTRRQLLVGARSACLSTLLPLQACSPTKPDKAAGTLEPPPGPYRTLDALRASLAATGVSPSDQSMLLGLARPAAALQSHAADDRSIAIGASKIGGAPDLPRGTSWPTRRPTSEGMAEVARMEATDAEDKADSPADRREITLKKQLASREAPLAFMLQVDLAACAATGPLDPDLPREGRLLVFYDLVFKPWSGREKDGNPLFEVLYVTEDVGRLVRRPLPDLGYPLYGDDLPAYRNLLPPARLAPIFTYTLPDAGTLAMSERYLETDVVPHQAWLDAGPTQLDASNRLGGWPESIQGDMPMELTAEDAGITLPFGEDVVSAARRLDPRRLEQWTMLLQIGDYDNKINDFDGLYYVWIKRDDLRARDFSKARLVYQTD